MIKTEKNDRYLKGNIFKLKRKKRGNRYTILAKEVTWYIGFMIE
jgi:hypothetical protein